MSGVKPKDISVRINLAVSRVFKARLDGLVEKTDAHSMTEVFDKALRLYEYLLDIQALGGLVVKGKDGSETRILLL
jgi:hypothetical protein